MRWLRRAGILCTSLFFAQAALAGQAFRTDEVIYQIYPRAFFDSSPQGDGIGDLNGIQRKLGYLKELGVDTLLLMPLHEAQDPLGYIPRDLFSVQKDYGSPSDLQNLTRAAHELSMRVLIDSPINHMADDSNWVRQMIRKSCDPWDPGYRPNDPNLRYCNYFYQVGNPWGEEPYKNWHKPWNWDNTTPGDVWHRIYGYEPAYHRNAYHYATFSPNMPDLKYYDHRLKQWNTELLADIDRYFQTWIQLGVDGFRIDAAKHLVEGLGRNDNPLEPLNVALLKRMRQRILELKPDAVVVGEIWDSYPVMNQYLAQGALDAYFDFGFMGSLRESLKYGSAKNFGDDLKYLLAQSTPSKLGQQIATLGNHDVSRLMNELASDEKKLRQAFFVLAASPFPALLYYGDEVGMDGIVKRPSPGDPREYLETTFAFPWTGSSPNYGFPGQQSPQVGSSRNSSQYNLASQELKSDSLYQEIKRLLVLRKDFDTDPEGRIELVIADHPKVFAYAWPRLQGGCYLSVVNFDNQASASIAWPSRLPSFCQNAKTNPETLWQRAVTMDTTSLQLGPSAQLLLRYN